MTFPLFLRALVLLLLFTLAEVVHGSVRAFAFVLLVGDFTARQIGTVTGCALIGLIAWSTSRWLKADSRRVQ